MNKLKFKAIISSLLLIVFIIVVMTGIGLAMSSARHNDHNHGKHLAEKVFWE